jgi:PKD repeat protein
LVWNWGDGQQTTGFFPQSHTYSSAGTYTVQVTAHYSNGSSASASEQVSPAQNVVTLYAATINGLQATINGSVNNSPTNLVWNWGDGQQTTGFFPQSHTYSSAGTYTVQVTAQYSNGSSASASESVTIVAHVVTLYAPSVSGLQVQINGVATPGASVTNIGWNWGDGQQTAGFFPQIHTYSALGTYIVRVIAYYNDGFTASATNSVSLVAHVVTLYAPTVSGLQVQINGVATPGNLVTNISWEWGDGQQTSGFFPETHTYAATGTYTVQVTAHYNDGSTALSSETVTTSPSTVSPTYSTLILTPSSVPADGLSPITAKATLRDTKDNPVFGRTIVLRASGQANINIASSTNTTDNNGQATTTITATTPGTSLIVLIDLTNVNLITSATATFTPLTVSTPLVLSNAIVTLYQDSANFLDGTIGGYNPSITSVPISVVPIYWLAPSEGHIGDYFQNQATSAEAQAVVDAAFFDAGQLIDPLGKEAPSILKLINAEGQTALNIEADLGIQGYFDWIANSSSGCSTEAQGIVNGGTADQQALQNQEGSLLSGIPQSSANLEATWTTNLQSRLNANHVLMGIEAQQDSYLIIVSNAWQVSHSPVLSLEQGGLEAIAIGAAQFVPVVDVGVDLLLIGYSEYQNYQSFTGAQNNYALAQRSLLSCWGYTDEICSNTAAGFSAIAIGSTPDTVTVQIQGGYTTQLGYQSQVPSSWLPSFTINAQVNVFTITNVYSMVNVQNTGLNAASFEVVALYSYSNKIFSALPSTCIAEVSNVGAGQSSWVQLEYYDGNIGALPNTGDPIQIYVLGINNTGMFYGGSTNFAESTFQAVAQVKTEGGGVLSKNPTPLDDGLDTTNNSAVVENPIRCQIVQNSSSQTYQATIRISNPFTLPLTATVTQPIPPGMNVLATDGASGISSIVWTNTVFPTNFIEDTFTFSISVTPGAQTHLPPPTVLFSDSTGTNNVSFQSIAPAFIGLLPVQVSGSIPLGMPGVNSFMLVAVTNLTDTGQTGSLTITLSDSSGNAVTNFSQSFSLDGSSSTNLILSLPGYLSAGSYTLAGSLIINGGTGQVLVGTYVVPALPIALDVSSTSPLSTNGFTSVLSGPVGNYVIEASSDISNPTSWQPILYHSAASSPFHYYFTDSAATKLPYRFYRVLRQ